MDEKLHCTEGRTRLSWTTVTCGASQRITYASSDFDVILKEGSLLWNQSSGFNSAVLTEYCWKPFGKHTLLTITTNTVCDGLGEVDHITGEAAGTAAPLAALHPVTLEVSAALLTPTPRVLLCSTAGTT